MSNASQNQSSPSSSLTYPITPYLKLLSSTSDLSSIQSIILKCISDPNVHVGFNELSSLPSVQNTLQQSSSPVGQSLLHTLDLFSYGVYLDYQHKMQQQLQQQENYYMTLNEAQEMKLKLLTVVSVVQQVLESAASTAAVAMDNEESNNSEMKVESPSPSVPSTRTTTNRRKNRRSTFRSNGKLASTSVSTPTQNTAGGGIIPYSILQKALDLETNNHRQLEDILIQCKYANLLPNGTRLDQKHQCMIVQYSQSSNSTATSSSLVTSSNPSSQTADTTTTTTTQQQQPTEVLTRDVNITQDIPDMISKLQSIYKRSEDVKHTLTKALQDVSMSKKDDVHAWKIVQDRIQITKDKISDSGSAGGVSGGGGGGGLMENIAESTTSVFDLSGKRQFKRSRGGRPNRGVFGNRR